MADPPPPPTTPVPRTPPAPRSGRVLIVLGTILLLISFVATMCAVLLWTAIPRDVIAADGSPGPKAVASGSVPGSTTLEVTAGQTYTVWATEMGPERRMPSFVNEGLSLSCTGMDGPELERARSGDMVDGEANALTLRAFTPDEDGTCTLTAVPTEFTITEYSPGFIVTEGEPAAGHFMMSVLTLLAGLGAFFTGALGAGLLVGGLVARSKAGRA